MLAFPYFLEEKAGASLGGFLSLSRGHLRNRVPPSSRRPSLSSVPNSDLGRCHLGFHVHEDVPGHLLLSSAFISLLGWSVS